MDREQMKQRTKGFAKQVIAFCHQMMGIVPLREC